MRRFEYRIEEWKTDNVSIGLEIAGNEGWELAAIQTIVKNPWGGESLVQVILKRECGLTANEALAKLYLHVTGGEIE